MFVLLTRIGICITISGRLYHILKLVLSININFKYYWSAKTGIPLACTTAKMLRVNRLLRFLS